LNPQVLGQQGGVCPTVSYFIGERIGACRMIRHASAYGEIVVAAGTTGANRNSLHIGWLGPCDASGLPPELQEQPEEDPAGALGGMRVMIPQGDVMDLQFAPAVASQWPVVATAVSDGSVLLHTWGGEDGRPVGESYTIGCHASGPCNALAWNPTPGAQQHLASAGDDGRLAVYDVSQSPCKLVLSNSAGRGEESTSIQSVAWHPQSLDQLLVGTSGEGIKLYDARQGFSSASQVFKMAHVSPVLSLAADGEHIVAGTADGYVLLLDVRMGGSRAATEPCHASVLSCQAHGGQEPVPVWSVALRQGGQFYSAGADGRVVQHGGQTWTLADAYNMGINCLDLQQQSDLLLAGGDTEELQFFSLRGAGIS